MADSFSTAVAVGVVPLPQKRPLRVTIEYTDGLKLVLENESLRAFWEEFVRNHVIFTQISAQMNSGPIVPSEEIQRAYRAQIKGEKDDKEKS